MKISSRKNKGRLLQNLLKNKLLEKLSTKIQNEDITSTPMGVTGEDLQLSPLARKYFPFHVECKSHKHFSVYQYLDQSERHLKTYENLKTYPLVCLKANRKRPIIIMYLNDFLEILYD